MMRGIDWSALARHAQAMERLAAKFASMPVRALPGISPAMAKALLAHHDEMARHFEALRPMMEQRAAAAERVWNSEHMRDMRLFLGAL